MPEQVFKLKFALSQRPRYKPELCFGAGETRMKRTWNAVEGVCNLLVLEKTPKIYVVRGSNPLAPIGKPANFILLNHQQTEVSLLGFKLALSLNG